MELRCAGNGDNPRLLCEQPGQSDLRRCYHLLCGELSNHIHQGLIRLPVFLVEARDLVAEILTVELGVLIDCPRQETLAQRAERDESNSEFLQRRQNSASGSRHHSEYSLW